MDSLDFGRREIPRDADWFGTFSDGLESLFRRLRRVITYAHYLRFNTMHSRL